MSYSVTLYHSTGFTALDIPASESVLASAASVVTTVSTLEIVQDYPLVYIDIKAAWADVEDVDYAKVGSYIYAVSPSPMQAGDVCRLSLTLSAITTAAGAFTVVGGTTVRTTQHTDEWGEWGESDELTAPSLPLLLDVSAAILQDGAGRTVTESTIDLDVLESELSSSGLRAFTFTDQSESATGEGYVITVPYTQAVDGATAYTLDGQNLPGPGGVKLYTSVSGEVLGLIRSLGIEGGIVGQIALPESDIALQKPESATSVTTAAAVTQRASSGLDPQYATVKNRRVLYGDYMTWGLITCAGNRAEYKVEDISEDGSSPEVTRKSDPRPNGAPYFRFTYYMGKSEVSDTASFWTSCVRGMQWRNVPLVWSGTSGSYLAKENFGYTDKRAQAERRSYLRGESMDLRRTHEDASMSTLKALEGLDTTSPLSLIASGSRAELSIAQQSIALTRKAEDVSWDISYTKAQYAAERENARFNFAFSQSVSVPQVDFPLNSSLVQDLYGNGVFVYRYRYREEDVKRIDKLLTMYGYKITRALSTTDLYPAGKDSGFTYTEAQGVSVTGTGRRWLDDLVSAQIGAGVRIWWQKPDSAAYE